MTPSQHAAAPMTDDEKRARSSMLKNMRACVDRLNDPSSLRDESGAAVKSLFAFFHEELKACAAPSVQCRPAPGVPMGEPPLKKHYPRVTGPSKRQYELREGLLWGDWQSNENPRLPDNWFPHADVAHCDVLAVAEMLRGCAP